jgi:hypothetical protein
MFLALACSEKYGPVPPRRDTSKLGSIKRLSSSSRSLIGEKLVGTWSCVGSKHNDIGCIYQLLTFSQDLESLTLESFQNYCLVRRKLGLEIKMADEAGPNTPIYFEIQANDPPELIGGYIDSEACSQYVEKHSNERWRQRYSLTHTDSWDLITIGEMTFQKNANIAPVSPSSPTPAPTRSSVPENAAILLSK